MKQKKLLNKTLRHYLAYGLVLSLVVIPAFYGLMSAYIIDKIDEFLLEKRNHIVNTSLQTLTIDEIPEWNRFYGNQLIIPDMEEPEDITFVSKYVYCEQSQQFKPFRALYSRVEIEGEKYILYINQNTEEFSAILNAITLFLALLVICLMAGLAAITRLVHRKTWKPFYTTLSLTEQFNIEQNEAPEFSPVSTKEFDQLNRALQSLMKENLQAYKTQKEFTENASHEMHTPLAVLRSNLDMLVQNPDLTEEQTRIIQTLYEATSRMARTNKNLLLLAKMENRQYRDTQPVNLAHTLEIALSFLAQQAEAANIAVETHLADPTLILQTNKLLLESLLNNLITNAIKHNVSGGSITITLQGGRLDVVNTGAGGELDSKMLFQRFARTNHTTKGSGLGLAIARQICLLYGWSIGYGFEDNKHRFSVKFL